MHGRVLILGAHLAHVDQKLGDGVLRNSGHPDSAANRTTFDQGGNHTTSLLCVELVHTIILDRSGNANAELLPFYGNKRY